MVVAPILLLVVAHQSSPTIALKQLIAALNANDHATTASLIVGGRKSNLDLMPKEVLPKLTISAVRARITGNTAAVKLTLSSTDHGRTFSRSETDTWSKASGKWQLVPAKLTDMNSGDLAALATFAVNPRGVMEQSNHYAKAAACLSNIKQLDIACQLYSTDHEDKRPSKGADVRKELNPYAKRTDLWICPETGKEAYSFNANLAGLATLKITLPAQTVLLYEGEDGKLVFRHEGRAAVGFVDGRAKLINKTQAATLRWNP